MSSVRHLVLDRDRELQVITDRRLQANVIIAATELQSLIGSSYEYGQLQVLAAFCGLAYSPRVPVNRLVQTIFQYLSPQHMERQMVVLSRIATSLDETGVLSRLLDRAHEPFGTLFPSAFAFPYLVGLTSMLGSGAGSAFRRDPTACRMLRDALEYVSHGSGESKTGAQALLAFMAVNNVLEFVKAHRSDIERIVSFTDPMFADAERGAPWLTKLFAQFSLNGGLDAMHAAAANDFVDYTILDHYWQQLWTGAEPVYEVWSGHRVDVEALTVQEGQISYVTIASTVDVKGFVLRFGNNRFDIGILETCAGTRGMIPYVTCKVWIPWLGLQATAKGLLEPFVVADARVHSAAIVIQPGNIFHTAKDAIDDAMGAAARKVQSLWGQMWESPLQNAYITRTLVSRMPLTAGLFAALLRGTYEEGLVKWANWIAGFRSLKISLEDVVRVAQHFAHNGDFKTKPISDCYASQAEQFLLRVGIHLLIERGDFDEGPCPPVGADLISLLCEERVVEFHPGEHGLHCNSMARVMQVSGQAKVAGVQVGWKILAIGGAPFTHALLTQRSEENSSYKIGFQAPKDTPRMKWIGEHAKEEQSLDANSRDPCPSRRLDLLESSTYVVYEMGLRGMFEPLALASQAACDRSASMPEMIKGSPMSCGRSAFKSTPMKMPDITTANLADLPGTLRTWYGEASNQTKLQQFLSITSLGRDSLRRALKGALIQMLADNALKSLFGREHEDLLQALKTCDQNFHNALPAVESKIEELFEKEFQAVAPESHADADQAYHEQFYTYANTWKQVKKVPEIEDVALSNLDDFGEVHGMHLNGDHVVLAKIPESMKCPTESCHNKMTPKEVAKKQVKRMYMEGDEATVASSWRASRLAKVARYECDKGCTYYTPECKQNKTFGYLIPSEYVRSARSVCD